MRSLPCIVALPLFASAAIATAPARAAFHFWDIKEIFSNADGTIQFIEFVCGPFPGEHFLDKHQLSATSDGMKVDFTFSGNLSTQQSTANRHFLAATAGFASLAGAVTPNYGTLPANFFNPNAASITINFASGTDVVIFPGSLLPKDGVMSLTDQSPAGTTNLVAGVNSPTNFAGNTGSIDVGGADPQPGDFDGDGAVDGEDLAAWRAGFGMRGDAVDHADGDADDDNDVDGADFLLWQEQLGAPPVGTTSSAIPEPGAELLATVAALACARRRRLRR